jgi:hypothetical protein
MVSLKIFRATTLNLRSVSSVATFCGHPKFSSAVLSITCEHTRPWTAVALLIIAL